MNSSIILAAVLACAALAGCASTSDVDLRQVDAACGQQFTLFPIMAQRQCADALKMCVQACPARKAEEKR